MQMTYTYNLVCMHKSWSGIDFSIFKVCYKVSGKFLSSRVLFCFSYVHLFYNENAIN